MGWKRGSVVLEAKPYAHVICQKFREKRCNLCLESAENLKKCGGCKMTWYCSELCQKEDWLIHKVECQIMKRVPHTPTDSLRLYLRLVIRYMAGAAVTKHTNDEHPCIRTFSDLMSHSDKIKVDPTRLEQFQIALDFIRAYSYGILQLPSDDTMMDIFGKMVINTFTIADEMLQDVGVAVYSSPSILDHRCWPNAVASFEGRKVIIRAVDDIASDSLSDVFLCYIDPLATTAERNEQLEQQYYFTCECDRCQNKQTDALMCSLEGSSTGDLKMAKDCLEQVDRMRKEEAKAKDIWNACKKCIEQISLPYRNVHLVRLMGRAFDAAIDDEEWEAALMLSIKNYKPYSTLHHPFNPCVGYLLANMGKLLMLFGRLSEASIHLRKALENFTVSLGENHSLYKQVREMMSQCEAELGSQ